MKTAVDYMGSNAEIKTAAVAMSGGVDSSVAAALMLKKGFKVIGLTMKLFSSPDVHASTGCCADQAIRDAQKAAETLGIEHRVIDCRNEFEERVVSNFLNEYANGRTPNPCVICNKTIKFGLLLEKATALGCTHLATGHYARICQRQGRNILAKAKDEKKDQSYFLWMLSQQQLKSTVFPLGPYEKRQIRKMAASLGIESAEKPESQEICFIPQGHYSGFLKNTMNFPGGEIVNINGKVLGRHQGIANYTIGQREGLGIAVGKPRYVIGLDPATNRVIVGDDGLLYKDILNVTDVNWLINTPSRQLRAVVKIRNQHRGSPALIKPLDDKTAQIKFIENQRAITPGQSAVFYRGDLVLGGGIIK